MSQAYLLEVMALGVRMAKTCNSLFGVPWSELLTCPLDDVRHQLGIEPVTESLYSWHSQHGQLLA